MKSADVQLTLHGFHREKGKSGRRAGGQARLGVAEETRSGVIREVAFGCGGCSGAFGGKFCGISCFSALT